MPVSKDRFPGAREDEEVILDNLAPADDPVVGGGMRYVDGSFSFRDAAGLFNPRAAGIDASAHQALDQLVHEITETAYLVITQGSDGPTDIVAYQDVGHTLKIREVTITYTSGDPTTIVEKQYASDGTTVVQTLTSTLSYTSGDLTGVAQVLT